MVRRLRDFKVHMLVDMLLMKHSNDAIRYLSVRLNFSQENSRNLS